jgi:hypothetical protein
MSVTLLAFGIDSVIELAAGVLIWRLTVELRRGQSFAEAAERTASRIGAALLFALAAYVVMAASWNLWARQGAEFSWAASRPSRSYGFCRGTSFALLRRSAAERCAPMPWRALRAVGFVVLIGLLAQFALCAWWVDDVTSLLIVGFWSRKAAKREKRMKTKTEGARPRILFRRACDRGSKTGSRLGRLA